ncbi:MAG: YggT family protein [Acidimicrobiia bacterium]|nr:YggT family protein [Acidimicrobiia bacterium]
MDIICLLLRFFLYFMLAWIILSYVAGYGRLPWGHPIRKIYDGMNRVMEPLLSPIRSVLKPVRFGTVALDLSPLVVFFLVSILLRVLPC